MRDFQAVDLPLRTTLEKLAEQLSDAQIILFRHVSWLNSGVDEKLVAKSEADLADKNRTIEDTIKLVQNHAGLDREQRDNLLDIADKAKRYGALAKETAEMGRIQASMAVMMIGEADQLISNARERIADLLSTAAKNTESRAEALRKAAIEDRQVLLIGVAAALLIAVPLIVFVTLSVTRPIVRVTRWMDEISRGNHAAEIGMKPRRDEIGRMIEAITIFKSDAQRLLQLERAREIENSERAAQGRLEMSKLADSVDEMVKLSAERLQKAAARMSGRSTELLTTATGTRSEVEDLAVAVSQASQSVQTVAAASEQMAATINELSQQVGEIGETVTGTSRASEAARHDLAGLIEAVSQISSVLALIQAIASRTNLLALNATIESARVGEAGKGFAVVAAEVKGLAAQTGVATAEITKSIDDVRAKCGRLAQTLDGMMNSMEHVHAMTQTMMTAIEQQSLATREIAAGAVQASGSVSSVAGKVTHLMSAANDTATTSDVMKDETESVRRESEKVNQNVDAFLQQIRRRA